LESVLFPEYLLAHLPNNLARSVPFPILFAILGGFVLLVGPGEWFVLGWLRRRRWTWLTFPVIAVGCTLLTVLVAGYYLGSDDRKIALVLTDFSDDGRPLRENRFDMWIAGRNYEGASETRAAMIVPMRSGYEYWSRKTTHKLPLYEGTVPTHYSLRQQFLQWTPYLQRTLTFAPHPSPNDLHWATLKIEATSEFGQRAAIQAAARIGAQGWRVSVLRRLGPARITGSQASNRPRDFPRIAVQTSGDLSVPASQSPLLQLISLDGQSNDPKALSPSGRPDLLDLLLDCGNSSCVVIAERQTDREIQVQRCVYHFGPDD
jgi:hypothetical protein